DQRTPSLRVAAIKLEDFRSYADRTVDVAAGVTAFVGPNGAGKTNILEAVHLVARGESSRAGDDAEMIRWGAPLARVAVDACRADDRARLEVTLFAPAVDVRRRPRRYTADGAPRRAAAAALGADPTPDVAYAGQVQGSTAEERAEGYRRLVVEKRDRERWQATTLVGPHREDLAVASGERPLPTFASRGEQRSAVLALKLAEAEWIRAHIGEAPIFLLDDVLSELDTAHREALCRALPEGAQ